MLSKYPKISVVWKSAFGILLTYSHWKNEKLYDNIQLSIGMAVALAFVCVVVDVVVDAVVDAAIYALVESVVDAWN